MRYLNSKESVPFLILSDVNLPQMDGFALKKKILESQAMNYKSIPFIFWSGVVSKAQVQKAYDLGVNGFFVEKSSLKR